MKVGDIVRVVGAQMLIEPMQLMIGEEVEIVGGHDDCWHLKGIERWCWINKWLEPIQEIEVDSKEVLSIFE